MIPTTGRPPAPDASLPVMLAARARSASDERLVLDIVGGLGVAVAAVAWRPTGWLLLLSAALCFASFGAWGVADRELRERRVALEAPPSEGITTAPCERRGVGRLAVPLRALQWMALLVGAAAAVTLLASALGMALGRMIS